MLKYFYVWMLYMYVTPAGAGNVSLSHRVQKKSGALPASYPMDTRGSLPGGKAAEA
jgi:hypothetical protein